MPHRALTMRPRTLPIDIANPALVTGIIAGSALADTAPDRSRPMISAQLPRNRRKTGPPAGRAAFAGCIPATYPESSAGIPESFCVACIS